MSKGVAFFDFDGTLIHGDSLLPFLSEISGKKAVRNAMGRAVRATAWERIRGRLGPLGLRSSIKNRLLRYTLTGIPESKAFPAAERLKHWIRWKGEQVKALEWHKAQGHKVVVATGALRIYMPALLSLLDVPVDDLLATDMEVVDGALTGRMQGGNCVRQEKADRVQRWMHAHGPFEETWGYGNRPSDLPMLNLLHHRKIV